MKKQLNYIKANDIYYIPIELDYNFKKSRYIKKYVKTIFGIYKIWYSDSLYRFSAKNNKPDGIIYLYPNGIDEVDYSIK